MTLRSILHDMILRTMEIFGSALAWKPWKVPMWCINYKLRILEKEGAVNSGDESFEWSRDNDLNHCKVLLCFMKKAI